ncbi:MAG TPA: hypothetical protein P5255_03765, partial [Phycisphaerae bacterium]|nr:hypothetical protein [Phycisphaerae bacterium]
WQALRQCARRAVASEPVPGDLKGRICRALAHQRRLRLFRWWGLSGLALASAALLVLLLVRPTPPAVFPDNGVVVLHPADFARIYEKCGYTHHHSITEIGERRPADVAQEVKMWADIDFPVYLPDISSEGFRLAGVCRCFPRERTGIRTVHANYVRGEFSPGTSSPPENVVSLFSMSGRIELAQQQRICASGQSCGQQRHYFVARVGENVTVIKWDEAQSSLVVCSCIPQEELVELVDSTKLAQSQVAQLAD